MFDRVEIILIDFKNLVSPFYVFHTFLTEVKFLQKFVPPVSMKSKIELIEKIILSFNEASYFQFELKTLGEDVAIRHFILFI